MKHGARGAMALGLAGLMAVAGAGCSGSGSDEGETVTVTESAADSPGEATTVAPEHHAEWHGEHGRRGGMAPMELADGAKPLEESGFGYWAHHGEVYTTDDDHFRITHMTSHYRPWEQLSWGLLEGDAGRHAVVLFRHGELLQFAPIFEEEPEVERVADDAVRIDGDGGSLTATVHHGHVTVEPEGEHPQLNLRAR